MTSVKPASRDRAFPDGDGGVWVRGAGGAGPCP